MALQDPFRPSLNGHATGTDWLELLTHTVYSSGDHYPQNMAKDMVLLRYLHDLGSWVIPIDSLRAAAHVNPQQAAYCPRIQQNLGSFVNPILLVLNTPLVWCRIWVLSLLGHIYIYLSLSLSDYYLPKSNRIHNWAKWIYLSIYLSIHPSIDPSICLCIYIYMYICMYVYI